jgi:hypothetical protein
MLQCTPIWHWNKKVKKNSSQEPISKTTRAKKWTEGGLYGRVTTLKAWGPEFNPSPTKKKKTKWASEWDTVFLCKMDVNVDTQDVSCGFY